MSVQSLCFGRPFRWCDRRSLFSRSIITRLDSDDTEQADLHGGYSPWQKAEGKPTTRLELRENLRCDALIVGGGITGSLVAERLTRQGLDLVVIDREIAGRGSTAASTSMLLWEIDRSLTQLTEIYGFERASRVYRASLAAVAGLKSLVVQLGLACDLRDKNSLYLATGDTGRPLMAEHELRQRAGLPGEFLDHPTLLDRFGMTRAAAIVSPGAADADPMQLAHGLLRTAVSRGARIFDAEVVEFDAAPHSAIARLADDREIQARSIILATGYAMPAIVHSKVQQVSSSWAIATRPQPQNLWRDGTLIWEDSTNYLYARTTAAGRIIIGGEDSDEVVDPDARNRLIPEKSQRLVQQLAALWPHATLETEFRWAGTFDTTSDGLPLIGPVPGANGLYAAYGYGGNGITFSFLAAQLIGDLIAGSRSELLNDFALDRDPRSPSG